MLRLRAALREFFPAALDAFADLDAPDALELLAAPRSGPRRPADHGRRSPRRCSALDRRNVAAKAAADPGRRCGRRQLRQPPAVQAAFAAIVVQRRSRLITALNTEIDELGEVVADHFGRHPDAEIYASQPGLGVILGARVLAEFGDDPHRYADAKARKNYAGTSPITRASGTRKVVLARYARNRRLADALQQWAFCSLRGSPGARAYYDALRARKHRPPGRAAPARQPPRRHPARLPENPHPLRREHRLGTPQHRRRLTFKNLGCLPRVARGVADGSADEGARGRTSFRLAGYARLARWRRLTSLSARR